MKAAEEARSRLGWIDYAIVVAALAQAVGAAAIWSIAPRSWTPGAMALYVGAPLLASGVAMAMIAWSVLAKGRK